MVKFVIKVGAVLYICFYFSLCIVAPFNFSLYAELPTHGLVTLYIQQVFKLLRCEAFAVSNNSKG